MERTNRARVRLFGRLHTFRASQGLPTEFEVEIPAEGRTGHEIASAEGLPVGEIEAVFRNGRVQNLYDLLFPGDRIAFVPAGTPGPYRMLLGLYREKLERERREAKGGKDPH
jgi:hypothetical protein